MKKFLVMLLSVTLLISSLSISAFAAEPQDRNDLTSTTFAEAYDYAWEKGIFTSADLGSDADAYMTGNVTRGDYAKYIARLNNANLGSITYGYEEALTDMAAWKDVDDELYMAVAWCWENGIVNGYRDNTYRPEKEISREEISAMIARYYTSGLADTTGLKETDNLVVFTDVSGSGTGYVNDASVETVSFNNKTYTLLEFCVKYGLIQGDVYGQFGFGGTTTRQQVMAILHRAGVQDVVAATTKFYLGVKSGNGFVTAHVNDSYIMQITVADATVDPSTITLEARMSNVASLGIGDEVREHTTTINTNIQSDGSADLGAWLNNCFDFQGCTVNINIGGKVCAYSVAPAVKDADGNAVITFIPAGGPDGVAATRAAWQELASHVQASTQGADDSKVIIAEGSYLTLDEETLEFEPGVGDLVLDNFSNMSALEAEIRGKVKVTTDAADSGKVEAVLKADSALAVGSSVATLIHDATIKVEGVDATLVQGQLGALRDANGTYAMAKQLVTLVNSLVGSLSGKSASITISFQ